MIIHVRRGDSEGRASHHGLLPTSHRDIFPKIFQRTPACEEGSLHLLYDLCEQEARHASTINTITI